MPARRGGPERWYRLLHLVRSKKATSPLDDIFYALSDPTRRAILTTLSHGKANVTHLASQSNLAFPTISKHLKVLERAKLIRRKADAEDGRAFVFEPDPRSFERASDWLEQHRQYWSDRFDELDAFVSARQQPKGGRRR